ncbi:MAG: hypothetical protein RLY43_1904 [Bacteroidota bacterium]|jgi:hypothetical protein
MTIDELNKQVIAKLDAQNLKDINAVMKTEEGRRFFAWLISKCGQDITSFTRDSRTYFNEGMRNIALLLEFHVKELGLGGLDLMHKSEKEYIMLREEIKNNILEKERNERKK